VCRGPFQPALVTSAPQPIEWPSCERLGRAGRYDESLAVSVLAFRKSIVLAVVPPLASLPAALVVAAALVQTPAALVQVPAAPDRLPPRARPPEAERREFHFTRAVYTGFYGYFGRSWSTDYPKADRQFMTGVRRLLTHLDASELENPIRLEDPDLRRYPLLYAVEVGHMSLTEPEVEGLRHYLQAGGFLVVDDFWGTQEWEQFEGEIRRVLPGCQIVDLPPDHPLFSAFYDIKELLQVPNVYNASIGRTSEKDGYTPFCRGIFDEKGRLMVVINANTDLGDAWEWAEVPEYPLKYSTFAYQMGVNLIVYGMSH
jgi:hypothetical protein